MRLLSSKVTILAAILASCSMVLTGLKLSSKFSSAALQDFMSAQMSVGADSSAFVSLPNSSLARRWGDAETASKTSREYVLKSLNLQPSSFPKECSGKEPFLEILIDAFKKGSNSSSVQEIAAECNKFPLWKEVVDLYGKGPRILGQDTCAAYRERLQRDGVQEPIVRVAGLYNTGTNAASQAFYNNLNQGLNISHLDRKQQTFYLDSYYRVPWGKHNPYSHKWNNTMQGNDLISKDHVLPIVLVRDPYRWMIAMCKTSYDVKVIRQSCPNLVVKHRTPSGIRTGTETHPAVVNYEIYNVSNPHKKSKSYPSLADLWTQWIQEYLDADIPRLIVRFEDMLFHAEAVMEAIRECAGLPSTGKDFHYEVGKVKMHGNPTGFVEALIKYGTVSGRYRGFTEPDLAYTEKAFPTKLMSMLGYTPHSQAKDTSSQKLHFQAGTEKVRPIRDHRQPPERFLRSHMEENRPFRDYEQHKAALLKSRMEEIRPFRDYEQHKAAFLKSRMEEIRPLRANPFHP